jgi:hypothetical protein
METRRTNYIGKRSSWVRDGKVFSLVISASAPGKFPLFWVLWMGLWVFCGIYLLLQYDSALEEKQQIFLAVFAGFWIYFLIRSLKMFFWKLKGREVVKIKEGALSISKPIGKKGIVFVYNLAEIKNLCLVSEKEKVGPVSILKSLDMFSLQDTLSFLYFGKEVRFGSGLDDSDAAEICSLLKKEIKRALKSEL